MCVTSGTWQCLVKCTYKYQEIMSTKCIYICRILNYNNLKQTKNSKWLLRMPIIKYVCLPLSTYALIHTDKTTLTHRSELYCNCMRGFKTHFTSRDFCVHYAFKCWLNEKRSSNKECFGFKKQQYLLLGKCLV